MRSIPMRHRPDLVWRFLDIPMTHAACRSDAYTGISSVILAVSLFGLTLFKNQPLKSIDNITFHCLEPFSRAWRGLLILYKHIVLTKDALKQLDSRFLISWLATLYEINGML